MKLALLLWPQTVKWTRTLNQILFMCNEREKIIQSSLIHILAIKNVFDNTCSWEFMMRSCKGFEVIEFPPQYFWMNIIHTCHVHVSCVHTLMRHPCGHFDMYHLLNIAAVQAHYSKGILFSLRGIMQRATLQINIWEQPNEINNEPRH